MSIPLVQNNDKDAINTSIIAIKRNIDRINMLLGLSNSEEIDTSEFVKKSDIVDVVEAGNMNPVTSNAVVPVDEVTSGNMQSVTSNAVSKAMSYSTTEHKTGRYWTDGKPTYEKTLIIASLSAGLSSVDHNASIDNIIKYNGYCEIGSRKRVFPYNDADGINNIIYWDNTILRLNNYYAMSNIAITLEYTKTTD